MDSQPWSEQLRADLRRQGLPPHYIDRLVEELADHALDSQTENPSMEAQQAYKALGTTEQLAATASREFRRRTFVSRHPWLAFVLGPVVLAPMVYLSLLFGPFCILSTIGAALALVTGNNMFEVAEEPSTLCPYWIAGCYHHFFRFVPFVLTACFFGLWGRRIGMERWAILACGIVAVMAGLMVSHIRPFGENSAEWMFGFAFRLNVNQLFQMLVPLLVGGWFLLRLSHDSRPGGAGILPLPSSE